MLCLPVPAWFYGIGGFLAWSLVWGIVCVFLGHFLTVRE